MEENYYDLNSETCGIKKGSIRNKKKDNGNNNNDKNENGKNNNNIELKQNTDNGHMKGKKKCC